MKFSTIITTAIASCASLTKALPVPESAVFAKVYVESVDLSINGKGVYGRHEGAGISYVFFGDDSVTFEYNPETKEFVQAGSDIPLRLSVYENIGTISVLDEGATPILASDTEYLTVNGSETSFVACKDIKDPYNYSVNQPALVTNNEVSKGCAPLRLKVQWL